MATRAVSQLGQLGVASGTPLDQIVARRLQDGDPGGHMRRGFDRFPFRKMAERIWERYYIPGTKTENQSYKSLPKHSKDSPRELIELCMVANFAEVSLAREGHDNAVGINYLEKIQIPHLPSLYGAMLAGAEYVLTGAGIPLKFLVSSTVRPITSPPATCCRSGAHRMVMTPRSLLCRGISRRVTYTVTGSPAQR